MKKTTIIPFYKLVTTVCILVIFCLIYNDDIIVTLNQNRVKPLQSSLKSQLRRTESTVQWYSTVGIVYNTVGTVYNTVGTVYSTVGTVYSTVGNVYSTVVTVYTVQNSGYCAK